ncbi:MAG: helix-turn-helix domain-containing protein [Candidatus Zixiibacteriota bacterium]|nr:MAG: helix-turn-helix domain-containing protein [candidate division Zixibacteria bacterium]
MLANEVHPKEYFSTGKAAALCSVTPDTVLKWIRSGKIKANRTPGGHHRIPAEALKLFLSGEPAPDSQGDDRETFQYCWEFNAKSGILPDGCKDCIVYRSGTRRCYEIGNLSVETGHTKLFCKKSCNDCDYYNAVHSKSLDVLVVTDRKRTRALLEKEAGDVPFNLQIADCEYRCSMIIDKYRPDYVVIDCSIGPERSRQFAKLLNDDPRLPFVRVILAGNRREMPDKCDKLVYGFMRRPITTAMLTSFIGKFRLMKAS